MEYATLFLVTCLVNRGCTDAKIGPLTVEHCHELREKLHQPMIVRPDATVVFITRCDPSSPIDKYVKKGPPDAAKE